VCVWGKGQEGEAGALPGGVLGGKEDERLGGCLGVCFLGGMRGGGGVDCAEVERMSRCTAPPWAHTESSAGMAQGPLPCTHLTHAPTDPDDGPGRRRRA
jgi:hypothetical protein